ncbi:AT-rich interactive domain-containing protein 5B [Trichinella pseudospiralis]
MKYLNWEERFTSTENTKKRLFKHRRASEWITDFMREKQTCSICILVWLIRTTRHLLNFEVSFDYLSRY